MHVRCSLFTCTLLYNYVQKLQDRISTMNKCSMNEKDKKRWATVLFQDFMSSEDSHTESGTLITRPIARSHKLDSFFKNLDAGTEKSRSEQSNLNFEH